MPAGYMMYPIGETWRIPDLGKNRLPKPSPYEAVLESWNHLSWGQTRMCQCTSSTLLARVPVWRKHPAQPKHAHLHPDQRARARLTFLDWMILPVLINTGRVWAVSAGTQLPAGHRHTRPAPSSAVTPGSWCPDGDSPDRQRSHRNSGTTAQGPTNSFHSKAPTEEPAPSFLSWGNGAQRLKEHGLPLCTEERGRSWQKPAAVTYKLSQHSTAHLSPAQTPARAGTGQYLS